MSYKLLKQSSIGTIGLSVHTYRLRL